MLGVVIASAAVGRPVSAQDASEVTRYLPARDRILLEKSDGTDTASEYYSTFGAQVWQSGPAAFGLGFGNRVDEINTNSWLRITDVTADGGGRVKARTSRLLQIRPSGFELRTLVADTGFFSFDPAIPVLPAGVRDSQQWTAAGTASVGTGRTVSARRPYAAKLRATVRDDGCVVISGELTLGTDSSPARDLTTWCPGRGIVATESVGVRSNAVTRPPRWQSLGRVPPDEAKPSLERDLTFVRRDLNTEPIFLYASVRPAVLPGPIVVYVNTPGGDLVARGWDDGKADPRWSAHPGGQVSSVEAIGRVVVAATTARAIVGYGDQGEFLWQAPLSDVSAVPIQRLGDLAVVAALDGTVTAFEAESGRVAWTARTPTEIRRPMVTDGSTLTVLDQAGNLLTIGTDGAVLHDFGTVPPEVFTVADGVAVVASRGDNYVRGYRLDTGEQLWRAQLPNTRRFVEAIGTTVVVGRPGELAGLRAVDGVQLWTKPVDPVLGLGQGGRLLVADRTTIRLLDGAGTELAAYPTEEPDLSFGAGPFFVAASRELFCFFGSAAYRSERR